MHFAALYVVFGSALFWIVAVPGARSGGGSDLGRPFATTIRLLDVAAPIAALSGVAWLAGTIAYATGGLASLGDPEMLRVFFFETPFGLPAALRLALMAALLAIAFLPPRPVVRTASCVAVGAALLVSQAWLGHAAEGGGTAYGMVLIATYAVHVLATATWVGGLPPLMLTIADARLCGQADATRDLLRRYSTTATIAVVLILLSGAANAIFHDGGRLGNLTTTAYGAILLTKVSLVAIMLVFAAINRFVLMPRLLGLPEGKDAPFRRLQLSVALDVAVAVLVLGAAAVLGITPPPL